jgi:uncharacterized repeat protein (TIGR03803 family)
MLKPPSTAGGGWTNTILYSFAGGADGSAPLGGLISDSSGALYGMTWLGGLGDISQSWGTVFKLTPPASAGGAWTKTTLCRFDGGSPLAGLISDASGALYGTTTIGGANGGGTVSRLTTAGTFFGTPGKPNCKGQSVSTLAKTYGGMAAAAKALGYNSVQALQNAISVYCG